MFELEGVTQHFDWGTTDRIPQLLGTEPTGEPIAEYWLGAHPLSPATSPYGTLDVVLDADPGLLGAHSRKEFGDQLPFLFKLLSAKHPLSLQAHPDRAQAAKGFARENDQGISIDDPIRVYRDSWPKPEILVALDRFEALTGFREPLESARLFDALGLMGELTSVFGPLTERKGAAALAEVFLDALSIDGEREHLLDIAASQAVKHAKDDGEVGRFAQDFLLLDEVFPHDRAIIAALLLNRVTLEPGQAFYVAPGQMHVYLRGTGIEVMANSDNVIRGGLTNKHLDVGELVQVVDFEPSTVSIIEAEEVSPGIGRYPTPCSEFALWRINCGPGPCRLPGDSRPRIAFCSHGTGLLTSGAKQQIELPQGKAAFIGAGDTATLTGNAQVFLVGSGLD